MESSSMIQNQTLKGCYQHYFKVGAACELIHERNPRNEIGNPEKEALICKEFGSITFANELKPAYNMGFDSEEATEEYLPFRINHAAKTMLDWAKQHQLPVRAHVLVWHSQCPKEIFCKNYKPITVPTDPEVLKARPMAKYFEPLKPECYVDRETLLKRLKSYVESTMDYMYRNGYASTIYAWDVVNEAIELGDSPNGLRNSYWYQIIGEDFIYYAFRYTKDAVVTCSKKYASLYGVDASDEKAVQELQPKLFYNDYNEWVTDKKNAIIAMLQRKTEEHGSILSEGLIDGMGLQCHVSDNEDIAKYMDALREYANLVNEIHITEMDVKRTCRNINANYYQAVFYKKFFEELLKAKREGANITSVTVWGLTDDNSWIRGESPLLFDKELTRKPAYYGIVYAVTGESLGEPQKVVCNLSDRFHTFEQSVGGEEPGFHTKGFGKYEIQEQYAYEGKAAIALKYRFDKFSAITYDVTDFKGQTIRVGAWCKSDADAVALNVEDAGKWTFFGCTNTKDKEWQFLEAKIKVPNDAITYDLLFNTIENGEGMAHDFYLDNVEVNLLGLEESFEEKEHIASIRGTGHLPVLTVVTTESVDQKGSSLLVTRQAKEATMKFDVTPYIGKEVDITAYVKTTDEVIKLGLHGVEPKELVSVDTVQGEWTKVSTRFVIPADLRAAELYIETNGTADYYVDDISVFIVK